MVLYVIRHGDPIYENDTLTVLGVKQADAIADRMAVHGLDKIYSSPAGRAKLTAKPTCEKLDMDYTIEEWMFEGHAWNDISVDNGRGNNVWPFHLPIEQQMSMVISDEEWSNKLSRIRENSDAFLAKHGYVREGNVYKIIHPNNDRVAAFCHQGFGMGWLAHLLQIPPNAFWHSFDITHSGVSIIHFKNEDGRYTIPRCLSLTDMSHIYKSGLPMIYNNEIYI